MPENKGLQIFNEEELAARAYSMGWEFAGAMSTAAEAFARGLADGFAGVRADAGGVELVNDGEDDEPELKTDIRDCRACWCDTCGKLEECEKHRDGAKWDEIRPFPCIGCFNGMRFKPTDEEPCAEYTEAAGFNNG